MPKLIDIATGEPVSFSNDQLGSALSSGKFRPDPGEKYTIKNADGVLLNVGGEALGGMLGSGGELETTGEQAGRLRQEARREYYDTAGNAILSGIESFADSATLGLSTLAQVGLGADPDDIKGRREFAPVASTLGAGAGVVVPILASGGTATPLAAAKTGATAARMARGASTARKILAHTPAGLVGRAGTKVLAKTGAGAGSRIGRGVAAGGLEGALFGGGQFISDVALENTELSAESFVGSLGRGALWGGALGGVFEAGSIVASATARAARGRLQGVADKYRATAKAEKHTVEDVLPKKKRTKKAAKKKRQNFEQEMQRQIDEGEDLIGKADTIFRQVHDEQTAARIIRKKVDLEESRVNAMKWIDEVRSKTRDPVRGPRSRPMERTRLGHPIQTRAGAKLMDPVLPSGMGDDVYGIAGPKISDKVTDIADSALDVADAALDSGDEAIRDIARMERAQYELAKELRPHVSIQDVERLERGTKPYADAVARQGKAGGGTDAAGKFSRLADIAAGAEVLESLGVPLPDVDKVPVVGPLLSMYLKWRAISKSAAGRSFLASKASKVAKGSTSTQNKISAKIDKLLAWQEKAGRAAGKAKKKVTPLLGPAGAMASSFTRSGSDVPDVGQKKRKGADEATMFRQRLLELRRATESPEAIRNAVGQHTGLTDPRLLDAITQTVTRKLQHLYNTAPKDGRVPNMLGQDRPFVPSRSALHEWAKRIKVAEDPSSVLDDALEGRLSMASVDTLKKVYPAIYQEIQMELMDRAAELNSSLPFHLQVQLSTLFGVPVTQAMRPEFIRAMQTGYSQQAQPPSPTPPTGNTVNVSAAETLGMHRGLMR